MATQGLLGLIIIIVSETLLFSGNLFVSIYFTPLVWTGYIFFIDGLIFRRQGSSLMRSRTLEFLFLLPLSIGFWLVFEFYNLYFQNWHYVGLPEEPLPQWAGYAWAFATIWPAILETAELFFIWPLFPDKGRPLRVTTGLLILSFFLGLFLLTLSFVLPLDLAIYTAGPVWLGFIFLLDPFNYWMGRDSLWRDLEMGRPLRLYTLLASGGVCGILWEFWNYWATAKWHYTVPILSSVKIFEMPVLGYLGFPPFALECYVMYAFVRNIFRQMKSHG